MLGRGRAAGAIRQMAEAEKRHLGRFETLLHERRVRPTLLQPLWYVAGYALGAATALLGERAAMACTVAVEEVIDEHYRAQAARTSASRIRIFARRSSRFATTRSRIATSRSRKAQSRPPAMT